MYEASIYTLAPALLALWVGMTHRTISSTREACAIPRPEAPPQEDALQVAEVNTQVNPLGLLSSCLYVRRGVPEGERAAGCQGDGGSGFGLSLAPPQQLGQTRTRQAPSHLNKPLVTTHLSMRGHQK